MALANKGIIMRCPNCKTELILSTEKRRYQTLLEHISEPDETPCEKTYYYCPSDSCLLAKWAKTLVAYWDDFGDIYVESHGVDWAHLNRIDPQDKSTYGRCGTEALDSTSAKCTANHIKRYQSKQPK